MERKINPSFWNDTAYWLVSMLRAALETLYAAHDGMKVKALVSVIEPSADELGGIRSRVIRMKFKLEI